jgi:hypothetical protein
MSGVSMRQKVMLGALLCAGTFPIAPASASANQLYVSQTGSYDLCTRDSPCDIFTAEGKEQSGDEVIIRPGTYDVATTRIDAPPGGSIHGVAGRPKPVIISASPTVALNVSGTDTTAADLVLVTTAGNAALLVDGTHAVGERLAVSSTVPPPCSLAGGALLRDSICLNKSSSSGGFAVGSSFGTGTSSAVVRNVTGIATGPGSFGGIAQVGAGSVTVYFRSSILSGTDHDVLAGAGGGSSAVANLAASNYATVSTSGAGTVTPTDTLGNQSAEPQLVDPSSGDLHELAGSPTINAGVAEGTTGMFDFDGAKRVQGPAVDIGAYEYDQTHPKVTITKGPANTIKTKHAKVKVTFKFTAHEAATFKCKLDDASFKDCESPKSYRVGKGTHTFRVRAADANGNKSKPATRKFTVKRTQ